MAVDASPYALTTLHSAERVPVMLWGISKPHIRSERDGCREFFVPYSPSFQSIKGSKIIRNSLRANGRRVDLDRHIGYPNRFFFHSCQASNTSISPRSLPSRSFQSSKKVTQYIEYTLINALK